MEWNVLLRGAALLALSLRAATAAGEPSAAQSVPGALAGADPATVQQLLDELHLLRARVQTLEAKLGTPAQNPVAAAPAPATISAETASAEVATEDPHAQHSFLNSPVLSFHGYADVGFSGVTAAGGTNSFQFGQADLFLTSRLSDRLSFLMETAIDADENNLPGIDIERIFLTYRHNEFFNVDVGRYHTALGYFNGAFHHGRWFQTAADRPFVFQFEDEGGILPIHNVGVSISGRVPSGALGLHYVAEAGNGRAYPDPAHAPVQNVHDENNGKSINLALYANPSGLPGWQFGASVYRDRLTPANSPLKVDQRIYTAHAVFIKDRIEFLNEGVLMRHRSTGSGEGRTTTVPAFYTQFSYRVTPGGRPYVRYEYMNPAASDPVVSEGLGISGFRKTMTAGYRFDVSEFCALKLQVERTDRRDLRSFTSGSAQLSFVF